MSKEELATIGRQIGIGAIKYADLSSDLVRDYVFDMDRMVAFEGNTGPYIQYASARISSLLRKGGGATAGARLYFNSRRSDYLRCNYYNTTAFYMTQ